MHLEKKINYRGGGCGSYRWFLLAMAFIPLYSCASKPIVYPVCANQPVAENEWMEFHDSLEQAVNYYFQNSPSFIFSKTEKTVVVKGNKNEHKRFVHWLTIEACLPKYRNSIERGQYVVCAEFIEQVGNATVDTVFSSEKDTPIDVMSSIIRRMDEKRLLCHRKW